MEVGAGLTDKLPSERVQSIMDDAGPMLKMRSYKTAVIDIIDAVEPQLLGRGSLRGKTALAVAAGAVATAAGINAATRGSASQPSTSGVQSAPRSSTSVASPASTPIVQPEDPAALDSMLMKKYFLLFSVIALVLGLMLGHSRLRQTPSALFFYMVLIGGAFAASWFIPTMLGSSQLSPAILVIALVQTFSGMRAAMAMQVQRRIGPDDDFELVDRAPLNEIAQYVLPGVGATILVGLVIWLPAVHIEQFIAILGTALIGVGHAILLGKLNEVVAGRPLPPLGSGERICTSPRLSRTNGNGEHFHVIDDSPVSSTREPDNNDTDNRGSGGKFNGDGASSSW